jgi:Uma2 family endonuclease
MPTKTLMTAAEFAKTGPETDGYELVRGELVPMAQPAEGHGFVCVNTGYLLKAYTKKLGRGYVTGNDSGLITGRDPDSVRGVDLMVFLDRKRPPNKAYTSYSDRPPNLAVEIRSPSQSWKEMMDKVLEYLKMGAGMVWIIDPKVKRVTVYTQNQEPQIFAAENELDGGEILPGFKCKVAELFEYFMALSASAASRGA